MDFSTRFMKSLSSFGRSKTAEPDPEFDVPSEMADRLTRLRDAALAKEEEALHGRLQHMATSRKPSAQPAEAADHEDVLDAEPTVSVDGAEAEFAKEQDALDTVVSAAFKKLDMVNSGVNSGQAEALADAPQPVVTLAPMKLRDSNGPLATIKWLASQDAAVWHYVANEWDWEWGVEPLLWMVKQSDCDAGTAAMLFWKSGADEHYLPFGDAEPTEDDDLLIAELAEKVAERFIANDFGPMRFAFDEALVLPHFPSRLEELYTEERLEWDASAVPVRSTGELVLIDRFDQVTEEEITRLLSDELMHA